MQLLFRGHLKKVNYLQGICQFVSVSFEQLILWITL